MYHTIESKDGGHSALVGVPSHPLAATLGALATGGATGAVVGTAAGPVGTVLGAIVGAVVGALGGDAIASSLEQAKDDSYWRDRYASRPYVPAGSSFDDYGPAFVVGEQARRAATHDRFDDEDAMLRDQWLQSRGNSTLSWEQARHAAQEGWDRAGERNGPSDT